MELLRAGARELGLTLSARHLSAFEVFYRELDAWNHRLNLTAIIGYEDVQSKHFLDSLSCLLAFPPESGPGPVPDTVPIQLRSRPLWCLDVGSGAGFPGLPIKILLPEIKLTLVESNRRKTQFLQHMVELLRLERVEVLCGRAEEIGQNPAHREHYDVVLARAVANLAVLAEYCLPLCRVGGRVVAQKGEGAQDESRAAEGALALLGGALEEVKPVALPGLPGERYLVVVSKRQVTPAGYPRRVGVPAKRPLSHE